MNNKIQNMPEQQNIESNYSFRKCVNIKIDEQ